MADDVVPPLFILPQKLMRWENHEAARLIADARLSVETAQRQLRHFVQRRWIDTAGQRRSGASAANLLPPTSVATAKVLSVLTALGVNDLESAALGLRSWSNEQPILKGYGSPVMAAMAGAIRGDWWAYRLTMFCGDQSGQLQTRSWVYDQDATWVPPSEGHTAEMMPAAAVTIHLRPLLLPLYCKMQEALGLESAAAH